MIASASDDGICTLQFNDTDGQDPLLAELTPHEPSPASSRAQGHLAQLGRELHEYFNRERKEFKVSLTPVGTEFQQRVWKSLLQIPYGGARSYHQQAKVLGNLDAIRAVAAANGANRIAIVIPCHRVIGSDGQLTGYAGGLWRKRWLLQFEQHVLSLF